MQVLQQQQPLPCPRARRATYPKPTSGYLGTRRYFSLTAQGGRARQSVGQSTWLPPIMFRSDQPMCQMCRLWYIQSLVAPQSSLIVNRSGSQPAATFLSSPAPASMGSTLNWPTCRTEWKLTCQPSEMSRSTPRRIP
jgi:hypothetical protein